MFGGIVEEIVRPSQPVAQRHGKMVDKCFQFQQSILAGRNGDARQLDVSGPSEMSCAPAHAGVLGSEGIGLRSVRGLKLLIEPFGRYHMDHVPPVVGVKAEPLHELVVFDPEVSLHLIPVAEDAVAMGDDGVSIQEGAGGLIAPQRTGGAMVPRTIPGLRVRPHYDGFDGAGVDPCGVVEGDEVLEVLPCLPFVPADGAGQAMTVEAIHGLPGGCLVPDDQQVFGPGYPLQAAGRGNQGQVRGRWHTPGFAAVA